MNVCARVHIWLVVWLLIWLVGWVCGRFAVGWFLEPTASIASHPGHPATTSTSTSEVAGQRSKPSQKPTVVFRGNLLGLSAG